MIKSTPFFSIIIPTLNEEVCLPLLLQDLTDQVDQDFEVIVVDGNSTDGTVKKAHEFTKSLPKLTILTTKKRGVSLQRNTGAENASGNYLIFMDADNRLPTTYILGTKYRVLTTNPDTFTSWCAADSDLAGDKSLATALNFAVETGKLIEYEGALGALIGCKHELFHKIGGFDGKLNFAEDAEFVRRASRLGYSYTIFHDPRFTYSLRRYRREGTLTALRKYAGIFLKQVTGTKVRRSDYPMGGNIHPGKTKSAKLGKSLRSLFDQLINS